MNHRMKKIFLGLAFSLTLYNTLPSAFFYSQPLEKPLNHKAAQKLVKSWSQESKTHNQEILDWISSYAQGLHLELSSLKALTPSQRAIKIEFKLAKDALIFERYFAKAMEHIPYSNYVLSIASRDENTITLAQKYVGSQSGFNQSYLIETTSNSPHQDRYKNFANQRLSSLLATLNHCDVLESQILNLFNQKDKPSQEIHTYFAELSQNPALMKRLVAFSLRNDAQWLEKIKTIDSSDAIKTVLSLVHDLQNDSSNLSHPIFKSSSVDVKKGTISLFLHEDLTSEKRSNTINNLLNEMVSYLKSQTSEALSFQNNQLVIELVTKSNQPLLVTQTKPLIEEYKKDLLSIIKTSFVGKSTELNQINFPVCLSEELNSLSAVDQENCLVIHSQREGADKTFSKLNPNSCYVIAKNLSKLIKESDNPSLVQKDIKKLSQLLSSFGFEQISDTTYGKAFEHDLVFENSKPLHECFALTHFNYKLINSDFAYTELGSLKEVLALKTAYDIKKQEALASWQDNYAACLNQVKGYEPFTVAKPTKNPLLNNLKMNVLHFFQGSEKKSLKFGLDLSGGKNILIQLEDKKGQKVTDPEAIRTGINELYERVNKLGVSEVLIRQEGDFISLDFPGSQNLSAKELVSASTMHFHVVNEEFSLYNQEMAPYVSAFLKDVWQEAQTRNLTDSKSLEIIAFKKLHDTSYATQASIRLKEKGLKLADPNSQFSSSTLDHGLSKIVKVKTSDQDKQLSVPLMIVFNNYALEGSALRDIQISYDPTKGNYLNFNISNSSSASEAQTSAQDSLNRWTTLFTKNKSKLSYKPQHGWRMAVILNSEVVNAPVLESALKDSASINGSFSQRDLLKLKSDLQAGSLSFQPKIILEQNVAPELGAQDKQTGFVSMGISLLLVTVLMIAYYRFHGAIAVCALLVNLAMLFACANFFGITLSLASIAGIVLTLGMAVDANVLVFERMKEEYNLSKDIKESILKGYQKAFTAIIDSNLTTMIAAAVLLGFDSGPIKGFALTLLIGLVTSVVTALFMTKFFYFSWMEVTRKKTLNFSHWFNFTNINFLKHSKVTAIITAVVLAVGGGSFYSHSYEIIGMDFKGGYGIDLRAESLDQHVSTKQALIHCFNKAGLKPTFVHIRELDDPCHVRIFLDPQVNSIKNDQESWANFLTRVSHNVVSISADELRHVDTHVSSVSGQLSETMKSQALMGLLIALAAIFVYVLARFEWPYAISATLSLVHDVALTLSLMALLSYFKVPVNLDMSSLAALLTIIGYSLNDTIIVFDRIREEVKANPGQEFKNLVLRSLNTTLSRTILTSATTLIVLIPMIFIGHGTLFNFSLVMTIGVVFGTLSTLFIACPLLLFFYKKREVSSVKL